MQLLTNPRLRPMCRKLQLADGILRGSRPAFTLVELLVVIGILSVLMALLTPVVFQARASAKNAAIKAEIDMLHMAIMNYKNEYGSFPPCVSANAPAHVGRIFPRCPLANLSAQVLAGFPATASPQTIRPDNAMSYWLLGYTTDPMSPLSPNANRKKLFDFDQTRVNQISGQYSPAGKSESPYIYLDRTQYGNAVGGYRSIPNFNADTFQILCAGQDGVLSEDVNFNNALDTGEDLNGNGVLDKSDDDLSNFWKGTRKEYLDSLQ